MDFGCRIFDVQEPNVPIARLGHCRAGPSKRWHRRISNAIPSSSSGRRRPHRSPDRLSERSCRAIRPNLLRPHRNRSGSIRQKKPLIVGLLATGLGTYFMAITGDFGSALLAVTVFGLAESIRAGLLAGVRHGSSARLETRCVPRHVARIHHHGPDNWPPCYWNHRRRLWIYHKIHHRRGCFGCRGGAHGSAGPRYQS